MALLAEKVESAKQEIEKVIIGKGLVVDLLFTAVLAEGHILLESVPGSGKTKLARSFANIISGDFRRVQFTPDVLPSDVTGIQFFHPKLQEFELRTGPVMANILLADEINRATPKTQSSLLEAMEEKQVTIDGETVALPEPFMVIATQNPVESNHGTFPLPEAQLDRFLFKIDMSYPSLHEEQLILDTYRTEEPFAKLKEILSIDDLLSWKTQVKQVTVSTVVRDYLLALVRCTREHEEIDLGVSTRGALALMKAAQAFALLKGRNFVSPADIKLLAPYIFEHRLVLSMEGSIRKTTPQVMKEVIELVEVPVEQEIH
ncbi:AAA family ATPase [Sediminibacillus albus]|uniref:MoxR-like ATPase n=1 Tax=Sediminibacillus albus TaxID=407036 RepID=A0A1G8WEA1_9BACI|nr:MoxR family ATPase [Sediminibacillus albus]SDJ76457.1 MoxR-like ATPase [Sediminibacillus albus]